MSDAILRELWATKKPPWNLLGPEIAVRVKSGIMAVRSPESRLTKWARQLRQARADRGLTQREVQAKTGVDADVICFIENNHVGQKHSGWARLAAFYGITLE